MSEEEFKNWVDRVTTAHAGEQSGGRNVPKPRSLAMTLFFWFFAVSSIIGISVAVVETFPSMQDTWIVSEFRPYVALAGIIIGIPLFLILMALLLHDHLDISVLLLLPAPFWTPFAGLLCGMLVYIGVHEGIGWAQGPQDMEEPGFFASLWGGDDGGEDEGRFWSGWFGGEDETPPPEPTAEAGWSLNPFASEEAPEALPETTEEEPGFFAGLLGGGETAEAAEPPAVEPEAPAEKPSFWQRIWP